MAKTKLENLWSGAGRLVQGSLTEKDAKDHLGQPIPPEKQRYFFGVAIPKSDPNFATLWGQIYTMAATDYANVPLVMAQIQQGLQARDFAWKIQDGDAPTYDQRTGQLRPVHDYMAGHWILKFSTQFEVNCCDANNIDISRADIKKGDYIDVIFSSSVNEKNDATAGIYLNPVAVRRLGFGPAIGGGAPASSVFGNGPGAQLPPGASAIPTAGGPPPMPAGASLPPAGAPAPAPQPQQQQYAAPQPQPQQYAPAPQPQQYAAPIAPPQQQQAPVPMPGAPMPQQQYAPAPGQTALVAMPGAPAPAGAPAPTAYPVTPYHGVMNPQQ